MTAYNISVSVDFLNTMAD